MRLALPAKPSPVRTEQIILFRISNQTFAISSASVQEVRSADSLSGGTQEINAPGIRKVREAIQREDRTLFIVNGAAHFGLPPSQGLLVFVLRKTRTGLLVDAIEKMTTMTRLQALPLSFCHEERQWYRGLTALDQAVVPVVHPDGFLSAQELQMLDDALPPMETPSEEASEGTEPSQ
jgi:chemotaxis signal transduction protein